MLTYFPCWSTVSDYFRPRGRYLQPMTIEGGIVAVADLNLVRECVRIIRLSPLLLTPTFYRVRSPSE